MTIKERTQEYQISHSDIEDGSKEQFLIGKAYYDGATDQDSISRADQHKIDIEKFDVMLSSARESFMKHFIEKACNWLEINHSNYINYSGLVRWNTLWQDFKQAMEEE